MSRIYNSVTELIGNTPLIRLNRLEKIEKIEAHLLAKVEFFNPGGSTKDRVALEMIENAEEKGLLKPDSVIIEPTSGNTGVGLAMVAIAKGYKVIITMPETMSVERRNILKAFGAELVLTPGSAGMQGAIDKASDLLKEIPNSFIPGQFTNPANPMAHFKNTGPEIWDQSGGNVDFFVSGIGTGGTISGVGKYLKSKNPDVKIIGVEPATSAVLSNGNAGSHGIQGIGAGFVPNILDTKIYDEIITVKDEEAYETGRKLTKTEGLFTGISSGAAIFAALILAKRPENKGKNIVALLPDSGDRYLSTKLFND